MNTPVKPPKPNDEPRQFAVEVVQKLRAAGFEALWAGGCVRDLLLGGTPHDYDVATSATPQQVQELFGRRRTIPVGAAFGVIVVLGPRKAAGQIEVATFRTDAAYSDGRRPDSVQFSTPEEDAKRRDFTINGMFYDPIECRVIDYVNGQQDLKTGVIRAIGDAEARIAEDKLRMLRAVRFAARFSFAIDDATATAIKVNAQGVELVSGERIAVEVQKTLSTDRSSWAVQVWHELGLLSVLLPEVEESWAKVWQEAETLLGDLGGGQGWILKLAALLFELDDSSKLVGDIKQRWKLSNADARLLGYAVSELELFLIADERPWSELQPKVVHEDFGNVMRLVRAVAKRDGKSGSIHWLETRIDELRRQNELDPAPFLLGQDLIAAGMKPGPMFRELLSEARRMQLDEELDGRDAALAWLHKQSQS